MKSTSDDAAGASVPSPCVRNCCLDEDGVCMGCGRLLAEIVGWSDASDEERMAVVERSRRRVAVREAVLSSVRGRR